MSASTEKFPGDNARIMKAFSHLNQSTMRKLGERIQQQRGIFSRLNTLPESVDFEDELNRYAYVFNNSMSFANMTKKAIMRSTALMAYLQSFKGKALIIACIGGGPGSEALGIVKYLCTLSPDARPKKLSFYIYDRCVRWKDMWDLLFQDITGIQVVHHYLDVRSTSVCGSNRIGKEGTENNAFFIVQMADLIDLRECKLATMVKFTSSIARLEAPDFYKDLLSNLKGMRGTKK